MRKRPAGRSLVSPMFAAATSYGLLAERAPLDLGENLSLGAGVEKREGKGDEIDFALRLLFGGGSGDLAENQGVLEVETLEAVVAHVPLGDFPGEFVEVHMSNLPPLPPNVKQSYVKEAA